MDGLLPWMVGGEVGKKGESPWQVTDLLSGTGVRMGQSAPETTVLCLTPCSNLILNVFLCAGAVTERQGAFSLRRRPHRRELGPDRRSLPGQQPEIQSTTG